MNAFTIHQDQARTFFEGVFIASKRIISANLKPVDVSVERADFVFPGQLFTLTSNTRKYDFWFGMNGRRLVLVMHMLKIGPDKGREYFAHCFCRANGWAADYQLLRGTMGLALIAQCQAGQDGALVDSANSGPHGLTVCELTELGAFWANEVAYLVQSLLTACERDNVECNPVKPRPF